MVKDGSLRERLREQFEDGGFKAQKGLWNIAKKGMDD